MNYTIITKSRNRYPLTESQYENVKEIWANGTGDEKIDLGDYGTILASSISEIPQEERALNQMMAEKGWTQCEAGTWHPKGRLCEDTFQCFLDNNEEYQQIGKKIKNNIKECPLCDDYGYVHSGESMEICDCWKGSGERMEEIREWAIKKFK